MSRILVYESWEEDGLVGIRNTDGKICVSSSPLELLEFIRYSAKGVVRATWDLDSFAASILRLLPLSVLESLARHDEDTMFGNHELYYLDGRSLRVGRSRFYGLQVFWPTSEPIPGTLEDVQDNADELMETLIDCGMPDFVSLVSPIAVFAETELGKQTYNSTPKGYEIVPSCFEALEYASKCDKREWISAYQLGYWEGEQQVSVEMCRYYGTTGHPSFRPTCEQGHRARLKCHSINACPDYGPSSGTVDGAIFDYDCNAMYSSVASNLLNIRELEFWKSDAYSSREQGAYYGFLRGRLYLDPSADYIHCSPIITDLSRLPGNPAGDFGADYYLTLDELRLIERNNWGEFQMKDGWFLKPYAGVRPTRPFQGIMDYLYQKRYKSELASSIMKGVANQLIGKLIETRVDGDYGELRNDIYHALILSQARVKVAEFLIQNEVQKDELVAVQTDGVRLSRHVQVKGSGMGSWRCNGSQPTIVASPYKVYCQDKKPGHLTYDHIVEMVREHPMSKYYARTVKHRTTLRQAIQQDDIGKVGELDDLPAHLDLIGITREQNRVFSKMPKTGAGLLGSTYSSDPIILGGSV